MLKCSLNNIENIFKIIQIILDYVRAAAHNTVKEVFFLSHLILEVIRLL